MADDGLTKARDWTPERAAHLLRRAGFGGSSDEVKRLFDRGLDGAVDFLVDYDKIAQTDAAFITHKLPLPRAARAAAEATKDEREEIGQQYRLLNRAQLVEFRAWWARRMAATPRPFEEKMTLFWHGHFTTGAEEVKFVKPIVCQNDMMRGLATGKFGALLHRVCRDPAMILYLDSASNRKEHPNENFARELLELFTLGEGHYTERDIKEAARAFTGYSVEHSGFVFKQRWHDAGKKTFQGQKGDFDGDDIADIILDQPRTAEYLAQRLLRFFVTTEPPTELIRATAAKLRSSDYCLKETMRALFRSEAFYAPRVMGEHVKSPAELVVGAVKALDIPPDKCDWWGMAMVMGEMGQELYQPPNVKGWDGGTAWISAAALVKRQDFVMAAIDGLPEGTMERRRDRMAELKTVKEEFAAHFDDEAAIEFAPTQVPMVRQTRYDPAAVLAGKERWTAGDLVDHVTSLLLSTKVGDDTRAFLIKELGGPEKSFETKAKETTKAVGRLLKAVMSLPEFQVS